MTHEFFSGENMGIAEKIVETVRTLPESKQVEVLDFIEHLKLKTEKDERMD